MQDLSLRQLPQLAIADGATAPTPSAAGTWAWSTTASAPAHWDGARWTVYGVHKATSDVATLGSELLTNGAFAGAATGWTLGSGWAYGTNNVVCTLSGSAEGTLSQNISVTNGRNYLVEWSQTNSVANNGTLRPDLGAVSGVAVSAPEIFAVTMSQIITANTTGSVTFALTVADNASTGTITVDDVTVKELTEVSPTRQLLDTTGAVQVEERALRTVSGFCTMIGYQSGLFTLNGGYANTAVGNKSLRKNSTGFSNMAIGHNALSENTRGNNNMALGQAALKENLIGLRNVAAGASALRQNFTGHRLIGIGADAGRYDSTGASNTVSTRSVYIGDDARPSASGGANEIVIGDTARGNGSNTATLGNADTVLYVSKHQKVDLIDLATPAAPSTDLARMWGMKLAGRMLPAVRGPLGLPSALQALLGRKQVSWVLPSSPGSATVQQMGTVLTLTGSWSTLTVDGSSRAKWARRVQAIAGPTTTAVAGWREVYTSFCRGNTAGLGGFFLCQRFGPGSGGTNTTKRLFAGLRASTSAPTDVDPASQTDCIGVGYAQGTDSYVQFLHNDSSGTCTKVDLGSSFPINTTDHGTWYELILYCAPNGSTIYYRFEDLDSGAVAAGSVTSNIPSDTTFLAPISWASVGGTSAIAGIALGSLYIETDY